MAAPKEFDDEIVYPFDLIDRAAKAPLLEGFSFRRCQIRGPAVVYVQDDTTLDRCQFHVADTEMLFWEVPDEAEKVGVIIIAGCTFEECIFEGIGLAGTPDDLAEWRRALDGGG